MIPVSNRFYSSLSFSALLAFCSCSKGEPANFEPKFGTAPQGSGSSSSSEPAQSDSKSSSAASEESSGSTSGAGKAAETPVCQNGAMQGCTLDSNGSAVSFPGGVPQGNCRLGTQICRNNRWTACKGTVGPQGEDRCEIAGDDADCDGVANRDCSCVDSQADRPCGTSEIGVCKLGTQRCVGGEWQQCEGEVKAQLEVCDSAGLDEDCDGRADLDDDDCECINNQIELCDTGLKGDCSLGQRRCVAGRWDSCTPRFPQLQREDCAAPRSDEHGEAIGDENCDGEVNNTPLNGLDPQGCQVYMLDEDGDGYGALGANYSSGAADFTYGCFCPGKVPNPKLVASSSGNFNRDCGDCEDDGAFVNPGRQEYRQEPSACLARLKWKGGAFDYNCSEKAELEFDGVGGCTEHSGRCEELAGRWNKSVPECGQQGRPAGQCGADTPPCFQIPSLEIRTQGCR